LVNLNFCCHSEQPNIKAILACVDYNDNTVKTIIHKFKYDRFLSLTKIFNNLIQLSLVNHQDYFQANNYLIIPVPLYWLKAKRRSFNQSIVLAKLISKFLNVPDNDQLLIRYKNNPSQAKISDPLLRQQNVANIFKINESLKSIIQNKNIILVDDVFTTGSTLNECAKVLKQNGANLIVAICLAK
jgi:ComF family protein